MRNRQVFGNQVFGNSVFSSLMSSSLPVITLTIVTSGFMSGLAGVSIARAGEYRGTEAQQLACTPDVFRFCVSQIPDADRIVVCLRQNLASLSGGCRAVFEAEASMQQQADKPADRSIAAGKPQRTAPPKAMRAPPVPAPAPLPARPANPDDDSDE